MGNNYLRKFLGFRGMVMIQNGFGICCALIKFTVAVTGERSLGFRAERDFARVRVFVSLD